jgi:hypothetical protein
LFDALHKDETFSVSHKSTAKREPKTEPSEEEFSSDWDSSTQLTPECASTESWQGSPDALILLQPSRDVEFESLSYFFSNYVNIPRDPSTNIFIEHLLPLYINAPSHSALNHSVNAVALNITQMWRSRTVEPYRAREIYGTAVSLLKEALQDPVESRSNETLCAVFLLDFYDSLNKRFGVMDTGTHQQGAVALLRHRGKDNFNTAMSQRLFTALRSRHINYSLQSGKKVQLDDDLLAEETAILPSAKLDLINAELANLHVIARDGPEAAGLGLVEFYRSIISKALMIDRKIQAWRSSLPKSWQPMAIPVSELHPSIREAGVYGDFCHVYSSLEVSHIHNASRSSHVGALRLIALSKRELEDLDVEVDPWLTPYVETQLQEIVDGFCASVPYHLGNRTTLTFPHEHREYPHVPAELRQLANYVDPFGNAVEMTEQDHIRAAAAIGGWFIMTPLTGFLRAPFSSASGTLRPGPLVNKVRKGQMEWLRGQMLRIQTIYGLPRSPDFEIRALKASPAGPGQNIFQGTYWNRQLWQV